MPLAGELELEGPSRPHHLPWPSRSASESSAVLQRMSNRFEGSPTVHVDRLKSYCHRVARTEPPGPISDEPDPGQVGRQGRSSPPIALPCAAGPTAWCRGTRRVGGRLVPVSWEPAERPPRALPGARSCLRGDGPRRPKACRAAAARGAPFCPPRPFRPCPPLPSLGGGPGRTASLAA
jgi:hypothetical protein